MEDYGYPSTELEKNPAYVAMGTDQSLRPQGDEDVATKHHYESPGDTERDIETSSPSDEHTLESAAYI